MRILHVVTLVSPDGAYGGPLRVAVNLAGAMRSQGHDVELAAPMRGWTRAPKALEGVPLRLFRSRAIPGLVHAGIVSPGLLAWLARNVRRFDVIHVHFARDLVTVPTALIARLRGVPVVLQPHGQIDAPGNALAAVLDALAVRRILRSAGRIAVLTDREEADLVEVGGPGLRLTRLGNGVPVPAAAATPGASDEVLFLARLQERKRPEVFVEMAAMVHADAPAARFVLVGPDEGRGAAVRARIEQLGAEDYVSYEGPLPPDATAARLRAAAVSVLPSIGEVFPMSVLESLAQGVPVVLGRSSGVAPRIAETGAGIVVEDDAAAYAAAVRELLLDPARRTAAGRKAFALASSDYSIEAAASRALSIYAGVRGTE